MKKRVVVGLSGGVDSSVAAYLLKKQGYEVIALFMRNWNDESVTIHDECPWVEDSNDALIVAQKLAIPFQVVDLSEAYKDKIVSYMFQQYALGRTPNPDILCNREIKYRVFLNYALSLNADYIATGHYCQKESLQDEQGNIIYRLLAGHDIHKDQSYFLCQLNQEQLSKALFPIGHLEKREVREIAKQQALITASKKDSQGLCFVGKVKLPVFLQQQLKPQKGDVIEVGTEDMIYDNGLRFDLNISKVVDIEKYASTISKPYPYAQVEKNVIGKHQGAHYYTVGQRKGLGIGGTAAPLFVLHTDTLKNVIYVGQGSNHRGLYRMALFVALEKVHWIRTDLIMHEGQKNKYMVRIRYRQALQEAILYHGRKGIYVFFEKAQRGIASGQFVAWYNGAELVGSGEIF